MYKGKDRELQFPHAVCVLLTTTATAARTAKSSGYGVRSDRSHAQTGRNLYRKRSAIETSYRTYREARATTTTPDPLIRFVLVAVGFCCGISGWSCDDGRRPPTTGGRDLPTEFTFELVCGWIRDHLSTELDGRYTWETNGVGLPPGYALATALTEVRPLARLSRATALRLNAPTEGPKKDAHARERLLHPHPTIPHHRLILQIMVWTQEIENYGFDRRALPACRGRPARTVPLIPRKSELSDSAKPGRAVPFESNRLRCVGEF